MFVGPGPLARWTVTLEAPTTGSSVLWNPSVSTAERIFTRRTGGGDGIPEGMVILQDEPGLLAGGWVLPLGEAAGCVVGPGGQRFRDCSESPVGGGGDGHRPAPPSLGICPCCAGIIRRRSKRGFPFLQYPVRPLNQPKRSEVNEPCHVAPADGFAGKAEGPACRSKRDLPFLH